MNETKPKQYLGVTDIGRWFGVKGHTVDVWKRRYGPDRAPEEISKAPSFPVPDVVIAIDRPIVGWDPAREDEIRAWHASRPGSGAGGGRPRKTA